MIDIDIDDKSDDDDDDDDTKSMQSCKPVCLELVSRRVLIVSLPSVCPSSWTCAPEWEAPLTTNTTPVQLLILQCFNQLIHCN